MNAEPELTQEQIMTQGYIVEHLRNLMAIAKNHDLVIGEEIQSVIDGVVIPECVERIAA